MKVSVKLTSIRLDPQLADEAAKVLGAKSRREAVQVALREIVALRRFKDVMRNHAGKLSFARRLEGREDRYLAEARLQKRRPPLTSRQVRKELGLTGTRMTKEV
jgi:Arc/MetJ family transcription regulator